MRHFTVSLFHLSPFNKLSGAHAHTTLISLHINDLVRSPGTVTEGEDAASAHTQAGKRVKMSTRQNEMKGKGGASRGLVKIRVQTFHDSIILSPPSLEPPSFPRKDRQFLPTPACSRWFLSSIVWADDLLHRLPHGLRCSSNHRFNPFTSLFTGFY